MNGVQTKYPKLVLAYLEEITSVERDTIIDKLFISQTFSLIFIFKIYIFNIK